jgi:hypothetical protein
LEGIAGYDNQKSRYNLDKKLEPGRHGPEIIKNSGNKDQDHRNKGKHEGKMKHDAGNGLYRKQGEDKADTDTYADKGRGKTYAPQAGDIAGMDFTFIDRVVPGFFMGQNENLSDNDD